VVPLTEDNRKAFSVACPSWRRIRRCRMHCADCTRRACAFARAHQLHPGGHRGAARARGHRPIVRAHPVRQHGAPAQAPCCGLPHGRTRMRGRTGCAAARGRAFRGMPPARCAPAAPRPSSPARGWCSISSLGSQTSWVLTSLP
jgi:hypothetical protein